NQFICFRMAINMNVSLVFQLINCFAYDIGNKRIINLYLMMNYFLCSSDCYLDNRFFMLINRLVIILSRLLCKFINLILSILLINLCFLKSCFIYFFISFIL